MSKSPLDQWLDEASRENAQAMLARATTHVSPAAAEACWQAHLARRGQHPNLFGRAFPGPAGASSLKSVPAKPLPVPVSGDLVELPRDDALWPWARFCRVLSVDDRTDTARLRPEGWAAGTLDRKASRLRVVPGYGHAGMRGESAA